MSNNNNNNVTCYFHPLVKKVIIIVTLMHLLLRKGPKSTRFAGRERQLAEMLLIRNAQVLLRNHTNLILWKKQFSILEDRDGILRSHGRINNHLSLLSYSTNHPIMLIGNSHLMTLYIHHAHSRVLHNSTKEMMTELMSQFWVIKGHSVVKQLLHGCYTCKR